MSDKTIRPMRLEDIHRPVAVWLEWLTRPHPRIPELMLAIGGSSAGANECFICENDMAVALKDDEYNVTWRAWAYECKPTDEQRKMIEWNR